MKKNQLLLLILALLIVAAIWYFTKEEEADTKKKYIEDLYSYGDLNISTGNTTITTGCTDSSADNYNPKATSDNGSCFYNPGCCDIAATNYDASADSCDIPQNNFILCDYEGIENLSGTNTSSKINCSTTGSDCKKTGWLGNTSRWYKAKCCDALEGYRDYSTYNY